MTFLYPFYFLLLIPVLFFILLAYFKGGKKIVFGDTSVIHKIYKGNSFYYKVYYFIIVFVFLLFISIISKPIEQNSFQKNIKNGVDIQIVLDISLSMIAEDLKPNRLEAAKSIIKGFIKGIDNDRVGIVVFAGKTFTSIPLSFDYKIIEKIITKISVETINQHRYGMSGTAIGDALLYSYEGFGKSEREKIIILLTDGETNTGVNPLDILNYFNEKGKTRIYTIGIGGTKQTYIKIKDNRGKFHKQNIGGINENVLQSIAESTNGKYYRAENKSMLENIFKEILSIEKTEIEVKSYDINKTQYKYFIYILTLFFLLFIYIKHKKNL